MNEKIDCKALERLLESGQHIPGKEKGAMELEEVVVTYRPRPGQKPVRHILLEVSTTASHCVAIQAAVSAVAALQEILRQGVEDEI